MRLDSTILLAGLFALSACKPGADTSASPADLAIATTDGADAQNLPQTDIAFPVIPTIVVPEILGVTPAQKALEASMQDLIDPIAGITVSPARCDNDTGTLVNDAGITSVDAQGNLLRNSEQGLFKIDADGSGTANYEGGLVTIQADGSGTINGDQGLITVDGKGAGTYNGTYGLISLDGKGAGTWNGDSGLVTNNGDGSGTWNGPQGLVTIRADGSGTWNGDKGLVINHGDGTGTIGGKTVRMAALPKLPQAGRFPSLKAFTPPGRPCGTLITLGDRVLFDFDKSDIRADAAPILDTLAAALQKVPDARIEIGGHTDAKGSDDYNQALSERRAASVASALRQRGAAANATSKGYGESHPVAPNQIQGADNPGGRQLNRRVEILVRN